ncbi:MAG: hypothetical protein RIT45_2394 [Pseudomonadota bacterium]|jgi:surfeit locus 1 family protein
MHQQSSVMMPEDEPTGPTRRVFRPRVAPSLIALVMLGVLVALGTWQARRYLEAKENIAAYSAQHDVAPPVTQLGSVDGDGENLERLHALHFRRGELSGTLEPDATQLLTARYMFGRRGYGVMMPMRVQGGPLPRILVHLGWVPEEKVAAYLDEVRASPARTVRGRLQVPPLDPPQVATGEFLGHPTWLRPSPKAIAERSPALSIEPRLMLQAGEQAVGNPIDPERVPLDGYAHPVRLHPNKHIEYSATWYGLALTLIAVWAALSMKKVPLDATDDPAVPPPQGAA